MTWTGNQNKYYILVLWSSSLLPDTHTHTLLFPTDCQEPTSGHHQCMKLHLHSGPGCPDSLTEINLAQNGKRQRTGPHPRSWSFSIFSFQVSLPLTQPADTAPSPSSSYLRNLPSIWFLQQNTIKVQEGLSQANGLAEKDPGLWTDYDDSCPSCTLLISWVTLGRPYGSLGWNRKMDGLARLLSELALSRKFQGPGCLPFKPNKEPSSTLLLLIQQLCPLTECFHKKSHRMFVIPLGFLMSSFWFVLPCLKYLAQPQGMWGRS